MKASIKKWLDSKPMITYEVKPSTEGGHIIFIPAGAGALQAERYFQRFHPSARLEWRASYTYLAVTL